MVEFQFAVRGPTGYLAESYHQRTWTPFKTQARCWETLKEAHKAAHVHGGEPTLFTITEVTPEGEFLV